VFITRSSMVTTGLSSQACAEVYLVVASHYIALSRRVAQGRGSFWTRTYPSVEARSQAQGTFGNGELPVGIRERPRHGARVRCYGPRGETDGVGPNRLRGSSLMKAISDRLEPPHTNFAQWELELLGELSEGIRLSVSNYATRVTFGALRVEKRLEAGALVRHSLNNINRLLRRYARSSGQALEDGKSCERSGESIPERVHFALDTSELGAGESISDMFNFFHVLSDALFQNGSRSLQ
ncbi:hypothetical protein WMY93_032015, partial [Mugilogobius chulae]